MIHNDITQKRIEELAVLLREQIDKFIAGEITREEVLMRVNTEIEEILDMAKPEA